jgi:transcriptional regulator with XRE-family HTH domain
MDIAKDIREFLMSRRARITPEQVGLSPGVRRRVPGLRREEAAQLAGVSTEYYTQIERGNVTGVSDDVLQAISRALRLSEDETVRLFGLVRAAVDRRTPSRRKRAAVQKLPDGVQAFIDGMPTSPAIVMDGNLDILAANPLGRALYAPVYDRVVGRPNLAKFIFFDSTAAQVFPDWTSAADEAVGLLQAEAVRAPRSPAITQIVGELATQSIEFRTRWAAHNVTAHRNGTKRFNHPEFGDLTLTYNVFELTAAPGLCLVGYTAEPNTPSAQTLTILASWSVTEHPAENSSTAGKAGTRHSDEDRVGQ